MGKLELMSLSSTIFLKQCLASFSELVIGLEWDELSRVLAVYGSLEVLQNYYSKARAVVSSVGIAEISAELLH